VEGMHKQKFGASRGFTLIELLIVIAIILILISIALPNFLEAQTRAKTTKSYSEMRSLATAVEGFRLERGVLLVDFWDAETVDGMKRVKIKFGNVGSITPRCSPVHPTGRSMSCVLYPLTSPVQYLKRIADDILAPEPGKNTTGNTGHDEQINLPGNRTYLYADRDSGITYNGAKGNGDWNASTFPYPPVPTPGMLRPLKMDEFVFSGFGPGVENSVYGGSVRMSIPFNPTNGTKSVGSLYYRSTSGSVNP
jgi:prepilin-type N-terminal cleavage/methylation domain-containing protein